MLAGRLVSVATAWFGLTLLSAPAIGAGRVVVMPVVVGSGPDRASALVAALAEGLAENPKWTVEAGPELRRLLAPTGDGAPAPSATLDGALEQALEWSPEALLRLPASHLQQPPEVRRQQEEAWARRLATAFEAGAVVLVSAGELAGADVLHARLYLKSGYLVRQALARLDASRARALGSHLATGRAYPEVLRPGDAAALVGAAPDPVRSPLTPAGPRPWYKDWAGWSVAGAGVLGLGAAGILYLQAADARREADRARDNPARQDELRLEAEDKRFAGFILLGLGGILAVAGGLMLAISDADESKGLLVSIRGDGAVASWTTRF